MNRHLWMSALLTVITAAAYVQFVLFPTQSGLLFRVVSQEPSRYVISPAPGIPLPTGLQSGDVLDMQQMTPATRASLLFSQSIKPGVIFNLVLLRNNQVLTVPVTSKIAPKNITSRFDTALGLRGLVFLAFLILGLLAIWRGRNWAAWGLGLFAIAAIISGGLRTVPVTAFWIIPMEILVEVIIVPFILIGLYLMAHTVIGEGLSHGVKKAFATAFACVYLIYVVLNFIDIIGPTYIGWPSLPVLVLPAVVGGLALISFLLLASGYTRAGLEQRLRIRWILCSTGLIVLAVVSNLAIPSTHSQTDQLVLVYIQLLLFISAITGYTYAVLRHRLVDVRIVINRTLVYGVITAIVVGIFAAISSLTERATLGHGASFLLELIVPLALGIVLGSLRKYVDTYINRLLFRRQYHAEKALNDFARTCGFIEQPDHLLDLAVQQVFEHSSAQNVAIYERDPQGYRRVRQQGTAVFPARVETDDLAFVRLRAGDHEADLHEFSSALGTEGYAFSMAVRGKLIGALVCGPRPAEQYTADERELLYHVAQQTGAALHALRSREHEKFVDSVASGALDAASARELARQLKAAWQPA
ncbi:MAG: GAF domain-containing protein [Gammaproteobacteria bacterium]